MMRNSGKGWLAGLGMKTVFVLAAVGLAGIGAAHWGLKGGNALSLALGTAIASGVLGNYVFKLIEQIVQMLIDLFSAPDQAPLPPPVVPLPPSETIREFTPSRSVGVIEGPDQDALTGQLSAWEETKEFVITRRRRWQSYRATPTSPHKLL